ncbi:MAG: hypothetical protein ACI8XO_001095 [Verrucomicrobiales bacterium]|jgi:hypothetical protein
MSGVNTSIYIRVPFCLADTAGIAAVTLRMKYDDGFIAYLNGGRIADGNGPASPVFNSSSTSDNPDGSATLFEDFDITAFASQLVAGDNVLAIHGLNGDLGSSDMLIIPELDIERVTNPSIGGEGYLAVPSPGTFNGANFEGFVFDTQFSIDRGFFDAPISVEITPLTEGATIRYTTDGSDPTQARGTVYGGPLNISSTTTLRAFAHKTGLVSTNIDTQTYLFLDDVIQQQANGAVPPGWPANDAINGQDMNYGMDPDIVGGVHTDAEVKEALRDVPTLSIVTPLETSYRGAAASTSTPAATAGAGSGRRRSS